MTKCERGWKSPSLSLYRTHWHRLTFPTIMANENTFSEPTHNYETPKDAVKTSSCMTSCFEIVLLN